MVSLYHIKMYISELKSNKASDCVRWWPQMDAYGVYKEFGEVMKSTKYSKLPGIKRKYETDGETEVDLEHTEEQKEALIKNRMAVTALTMAFRDNEDQYCMNMVFNLKTADWPLDQTQDEYAPIDLIGDMEQQRELEAICMKRNANPKVLFSQITAIKNKYRGRTSALTEKNKLTNIILRAPEEYYAQTIHTARQLTNGGNLPREPTVKEL